MKSLQRHNSFSRAPVFTQIVAYSVVITSFIIFSVSIQTNFLNLTLRATLNVLYYSTFTALLIAAAVTSCTDPGDKLLNL